MNKTFMERAIELAKTAMNNNEVPVGAVVVCNDEIVGEGYNKRKATGLISKHAEIIAIEAAQQKLQKTMLEDCEIYVTLEPCIMCAAAIQQSRIRKVYYGVKDIKMGGFGSKIDITAIQGLNHYPIVSEITEQQQCGDLLKDFFKRIRSAK
ncbi:MAG: nucleoside deaminase [Erysipelotrichaceae bacterium]